MDLVAGLRNSFTVLEVTVDASVCESTARGFIDELVKQILEVRGADSFAVGESSAGSAKHLRRSPRF